LYTYALFSTRQKKEREHTKKSEHKKRKQQHKGAQSGSGKPIIWLPRYPDPTAGTINVSERSGWAPAWLRGG